ncbi:MAG: SOS response-associated peptidase [Cyanobacteria bacterium]|nr:SOS response-associated peptidase [Cyanobacteriota bacterium]
MCGRYTVIHSHKEIIERFRVERAQDEELAPRYNVAPSQVVPIIIDEKSESGEAVRVLQSVRWGLVPSWVKDLTQMRPMINARGETLVEKPTFRSAFKRRRCLIPSDGFYEWKKVDKAKLPMRIRLKGGGLFAFAGLYEDWRKPDGSYARTCSIITVAANELVSEVHDRMPAILHPDQEDEWLSTDGDEKAKLLAMLSPYDDEAMEFYAVSKTVNSAKNELPECIEPLNALGLAL